MGEITDALKRARLAARAREAVEQVDSRPEMPTYSSLPDAEEEAAVAQRVKAPAHDHDPEQVELPLDRVDEWPARAVAIEQRGAVAEAFRHLAIKVRTTLERRGARSVAVTGPLQNEGKTTIACNLALAMASLSPRRTVALVDLDLRLSSVAADLRLPAGAGIEEVLAGRKSLEDVRIPVEAPPLDVYPACEPTSAPHELLGSPEFAAVVRELERRYAVIVYDTPPALVVSDTRLILGQVGTWIAVARSGSTRERAFRKMMELLPTERLLGATLNEGPMATGVGYYDHYYYGGSRSQEKA